MASQTKGTKRVSKVNNKVKFLSVKRNQIIAVGVAVAILVGGIGTVLLNKSDAATGCRTQTLRQGSRSARSGCVGTLQIAVNVTPDGAFGPKTKAAVQRFQSRVGIRADGVAGPQTWTAICRSINTFNRALGYSAGKIGCVGYLPNFR